MSTESAPPRNPQADEMIAAVKRQTISNAALAAAVGALTIAVTNLTAAIENEEDEHDDDCEDEECEGECLDEPAPRRKRKR